MRHNTLLLALGLLLTVTVRAASISEELKVDITDKFDYCWGGSSESVTLNADGTLTYKSKQWGGMVYRVGNKDWSEYEQVVFELAAPSPCAVQPLVIYPDDQPSDAHYMNAGTTTAYVDLSPDKRKKVSQVAFQTSEATTIIIKRVYLVKNKLPEYGEQKGQLKISELMQSNIDCLMDDLNDFPDSWVELYNNGTTAVSLGKYKLG